MTPLRTLSIGGATYDIFLAMDGGTPVKDGAVTFGVGKKVRIQGVTETCGGGANNSAVGLQRLGCSAAFCGIVGSDQWGDRLLENLKKEGVDTASATIVDKETSSFSIVLLLPSGERTILYTPGVNEHLRDVTFDKDAIAGAHAVYLNRLSETACEIENDIIAMLDLREGLHLTWNPGGCQLEAGMHAADKAKLLKRTNLLLLNKEEAIQFTGEKDTSAAMKALLKAGVKAVCVTDGGNGTWAADATGSYFCPTVQDAKIVDTTGAGDAFGTGATWALLRGESLQTALIAGTLNATSVIGVIGAQPGLLTETQMQSQIKKSALTVQTI